MQKHLRCLKWKLARIDNSHIAAWRLTLMDAMGPFFYKFVFKFNEHIYDICIFNETFLIRKISHFKNDNYLLQKYFGPSAIVAFKGLPWHLRLWIHVCSQKPLLTILACQTKSVSNTAILLKLNLWQTKNQINLIQKKNNL